MNRHTSVMKCGMTKTIFSPSYNTKGLSKDQAQPPSTGPSWEMLPAPLGKYRDISKPRQLPGMHCHQDSWIQQLPEPLDNFPHSVRWQEFAHVLLAGLTAHREGRFMHCIPAWSVEMAEKIKFISTLLMTSTGCWIKHPDHLQHTKETYPLFRSWQNEMKSRSKASSPCNNSHQVSSGLRGLSLLLPQWHQRVCCYRSPAQHCNGKLLKEFLSLSQSSSISTAKRRNTSRIRLNIKIGTYQNWPLSSAFCTHYNWWSAKKEIKVSKKATAS